LNINVEGSRTLQNVSTLLPDYTASDSRRQQASLKFILYGFVLCYSVFLSEWQTYCTVYCSYRALSFEHTL
jgi:hypothetical protein